MPNVKYSLLLISFSTLVMINSYAGAKDEAGIHFSDTVLSSTGEVLSLNGTGLRKRWFFKIYAAGLYLPEKVDRVEAILNSTGPKRVRMVFLFRKIPADKIAETFDQGFKDNHSDAQLESFAEKIKTLKSLFKTVRKGDEVILDYVPNVGTHIIGNGELLGTISGFEFNQALLRVWLGDKPADKNLKAGFLGSDEHDA